MTPTAAQGEEQKNNPGVSGLWGPRHRGGQSRPVSGTVADNHTPAPSHVKPRDRPRAHLPCLLHDEDEPPPEQEPQAKKMLERKTELRRTVEQWAVRIGRV